ncbi:sulfotransferase family protein [Luteimonas mephitis]|uniref:sulfotransferase family protein n=1 Tax=Luteimonas mephitis TaxID=83615 RepID=UPI0003FB767D|nr:sulfotransferase [Luteimonas mephitis]
MRDHAIIVGAQRSGTTFLYQALDCHPDACMARPLRPEPKFFLRGDLGPERYEEYLSIHFGHLGNERLLVEKSTSYIEHESSAVRIKAMLPQACIIVILRDPVQRAYSNWRFSRDNGIEDLDFARALDAEQDRCARWDRDLYSVCPFAYAARGDYVRHLEVWARHFPREQLLVVTSEALFEQGTGALARLLARLGLCPDAIEPGRSRINAAGDAEGIDPESLLRLSRRYRESNRRLADEWQVDTSSWTG